jgi:hypothetical protein
MVYIARNALSGSGRWNLSTSREAVPNSNQCIRVGTDRDHRISTKVGASRTAPDARNSHLNRTALAPAAQPRPAPPGRALPEAPIAATRVPIRCKSGVPFRWSLTINGLARTQHPVSNSKIAYSWRMRQCHAGRLHLFRIGACAVKSPGSERRSANLPRRQSSHGRS